MHFQDWPICVYSRKCSDRNVKNCINYFFLVYEQVLKLLIQVTACQPDLKVLQHFPKPLLKRETIDPHLTTITITTQILIEVNKKPCLLLKWSLIKVVELMNSYKRNVDRYETLWQFPLRLFGINKKQISLFNDKIELTPDLYLPSVHAL